MTHSHPSLLKVMEVAKGVWGMEYDSPLATVLAAARSRVTQGEPLWVIVIGAPSSGKTERLRCVANAMMREDVMVLDKLTPASFITGARDDEGTYRDLLPDLDKRLLVIGDLSPLLSMDAAGRDSIMGDLRTIYDGSFSRNLSKRGVVRYDSRVTIAAACTPAWESYHSVIGVLGQRFLIVRVPAKDPEQPKESFDERKTKVSRLSSIIKDYLDGAGSLKTLTGEDGWHDRVWASSEWLARIRGNVPRDSFKMVMSEPIIESPYRVYRQLSILAASGGPELAERVARDSGPRLRVRVADAVAKGERTIDGVCAVTGLARSPVERTLEDLVMLGVMREDATVRPYTYTLAGRWF